MSKIISIGKALPNYKYQQRAILDFMLEVYQPSPADRRKMTLLYDHSGIESRYSVIADYADGKQADEFYPRINPLGPFPSLEKRMEWYHRYALPLSVQAIEDCMKGYISKDNITHLITVSCTGMSAPGLDIQLMEAMQLRTDLVRTSVNFMGCYAAIHALKMADAICRADASAKVMIVCTELCTLHFQKGCEMNNIASSLLFADGAAATLVTADSFPQNGLQIAGFHAEVTLTGKADMAWNISAKGFLMTLSAYIPQLIQSGIRQLLQQSLQSLGIAKNDIAYWAIHPGGKRILQVVQEELELGEEQLAYSRKILREYGNMSSPTILFVLREIMNNMPGKKGQNIFAVAFGPGLTMETMMLKT